MFTFLWLQQIFCSLTHVSFAGYDICELIITSQAFLWHQIRCLMGILLLIGQGKEEPEVILQLLNITKCPRKPQYNLAHEIPLNLWYCEYESNEWYIDKEELLNTLRILQKDWTLNTIKYVHICLLIKYTSHFSKCNKQT